jgi:Zn-dependent protease
MNIADGILWYVVFLLSTVVHEAAHAFTAHKMGDSTAHSIGQVSLNPVPHIKREPFGTVVVPILSFIAGGWMIGWASTPYNPQWAYDYPKKAAAMAAAGPISNFTLMMISVIIIHIGIAVGFFIQPDTITISGIVSGASIGWTEILAKIVSVMFSLNLILFVFNLLPFPPLDGSAVPPMYLSEEAGRKYINFVRKPVFALVGLFVAWNLFGTIYSKVNLLVINLLYPGSNYH